MAEYKLPFTAKEIEEKLNKVGQPISWNELNDRPFSEEIEILGDTITWDGTPTDCFVAELGMEMHRVSENTPSKAELIGGTIVLQIGTESTSDELTEDNVFQETDDIVVCGGGGFPFMLVVYKDNASITPDGINITFPQKGIYFLYVEDLDGVDGYNVFTSSLTINGYNFTKTTITPIDPKFLPEHSWNNLEDKPFGEEIINCGDTLTWDGMPTDDYIEYGGMRAYRVSNSIPNMDEWIGATISVSTESEAITITEYEVFEMADSVYAVADIILVVTADNTTIEADDGVYITIPKKGIYCFSFHGAHMTSCCIQGYNFTKKIVKNIDPKYLPDGGFGYEKKENLGNTLVLPETTPINPTDVFVKYQEIGGYIIGVRHISDNTPSKEELIGGTFLDSNNASYEISEDMIMEDTQVLGVIADGMPVIGVALVDNATCVFDGTTFTFAKKGIYIACMTVASVSYCANMVRSITLPNYNFTETMVHGIDHKYLPTDGFGYEVVKHAGGDTLRWDGTPTDVATGEVEFDNGGGDIVSGGFYLVSGKMPTEEQIKTGMLGFFDANGGHHLKELSDSDVNVTESINGYKVAWSDILFFVALADDVTISETQFPKRGIYFQSMSLNGVPLIYYNYLQIPNFDFGETEIHKIDEKFLPETGLVISLDEELNPSVTAAEFIDAIENNRPMVLRAHIKDDLITSVFNSQTYAAIRFGDLYAASFICTNPFYSTGLGAESVAVYKIICSDKETLETETKALILPAVYADNGTVGAGRPQYLYQKKVESAIDYGLTDRIMMYSPNGTMYYITVSDDGTLSASTT